MSWNDDIIHDLRGIRSFVYEDARDGGSALVVSGAGRFTAWAKPTVAFGRGVVYVDPPVNGLRLCDDPQLIACMAKVFEGWPGPYTDGTPWPHLIASDRQWDADAEPGGAVDVPAAEQARDYLFDHRIPHPGTHP